jgi:hypothetical protein
MRGVRSREQFCLQIMLQTGFDYLYARSRSIDVTCRILIMKSAHDPYYWCLQFHDWFKTRKIRNKMLYGITESAQDQALQMRATARAGSAGHAGTGVGRKVSRM